jgi:choline dehydrogenase-like flavoprotein
MRDAPQELDTDRLGSLASLPRVHLVDASVLPDLAATTLTYTVMANAHRIASEVARQDGAA